MDNNAQYAFTIDFERQTEAYAGEHSRTLNDLDQRRPMTRMPAV